MTAQPSTAPPPVRTGLVPPCRLRRATDADADAVLRWRNHPKVRQASFTRRPISAPEHAAWWRRVSADPAHHLLIFEWQGVAAGVVTLHEPTPADGSAGWAFYLDVDGLQRIGALLPAWVAAERAALGYAFDTAGLRVLRGEVLAENRPVLDLHRRFGFAVTGTHQRDIDGVRHDVLRVELTCDDRRDAPRRHHDRPAGAAR
ncbi:MAG TPA: GNAT family N-acetyltransferase [Catenuloplanes sp.]|jgi:RimJ/RimL family protein N-acetyltransferase